MEAKLSTLLEENKQLKADMKTLRNDVSVHVQQHQQDVAKLLATVQEGNENQTLTHSIQLLFSSVSSLQEKIAAQDGTKRKADAEASRSSKKQIVEILAGAKKMDVSLASEGNRHHYRALQKANFGDVVSVTDALTAVARGRGLEGPAISAAVSRVVKE